MDFKKIFNQFTWHAEESYNFSIPQTNDKQETNYIPDNNLNISKNVFSDLASNLNYIKTRFNTLINSDVIIREFKLFAKSKQYKAFLLFIDGMVDSNLINDFVLKPLMTKDSTDKNDIISESNQNNVTIRKVKKFDIEEYISNCLLPQNNIKKQTEFDTIISDVTSGNCILFIDTIPSVFSIEVKGFKQRSVDVPNNEIIIKGPQEAFVENIRVNTSLLRRIVNTEKLIIENISIGDITKTKCAICYIDNITNDDLVAEVKYRMNNLEIDSLISSGQLEQLIVDDNQLGIPEVLSTERPDKTAKYLLKGRVVVLVNGSPYSLIMPATLIDFLSSPEDTNLKPAFSNFLKTLRFISCIITLLLPGLYVAVTSFHQEILPTELLYSILSTREIVPFPIIFEIIIMEVSFELIREAGLRVPSPIGPTIGIVGALVLGQAAVSANIVSPILIIIVAITGIASFAIPDFSFGFHLRFFRFIFILLGYIAGFLGISIGILVYLSILCNVRSFGIPFMIPFAPAINSKGNSFYIPPIWKQEYRATYLAPKKQKAKEDISMKWKF